MTVWAFKDPSEDRFRDYIIQCLNKGESRFGWGYADLRILSQKKLDEMSDRERLCWEKSRFLVGIESHDWVVHVNMPIFGSCTAAQVCGGYDFALDADIGDFGHRLPIDGTAIEQVTYYCTGPDAKGMGRMVEDGFVILNGSTARTESVASAHKYIATKRQALVSSGVLVPDGPTSLHFTEDYLCDSQSGAAMLLLGRTANGWNDWKTEDGRTLDEVERHEILATEDTSAG